MVDLQQELQKRQLTWARFIRYAFWSAGATAALLLLLWLFLI